MRQLVVTETRTAAFWDGLAEMLTCVAVFGKGETVVVGVTGVAVSVKSGVSVSAGVFVNEGVLDGICVAVNVGGGSLVAV